MAATTQPIGVFDSGIGGLTVASAIMRTLPHEKIVYFGDTAHLPYGDKSADAIRYYCLRIGKFLLEQNCKMIVIACNSASSAGYRMMLDFFKDQVLLVNVVDPLVRHVAAKAYQRVGVIATKATISSGIYPKQLHLMNPNLEVGSLATPLLAPMIEEGFLSNEISKTVLENYLSRPELQGIEALLLACTHYPLIQREIAQYYDNKIDIIDSTAVTAQTVKNTLQQYQLLNPKGTPRHQFFVSDYTPSFEAATRIFHSDEVHLEHCPIWD